MGLACFYVSQIHMEAAMTIRAAVLLALISSVVTPLQAQDIRYASSSVRVRAEASAESAVVGTIAAGNRVSVRACAVDWCWVEHGKKTGYVSARYLSATPPFEKGNGKGYKNTKGTWVPSPKFSSTPPAGASARCRDGTYSFSQSRRGTCSNHGGVSLWL